MQERIREKNNISKVLGIKQQPVANKLLKFWIIGTAMVIAMVVVIFTSSAKSVPVQYKTQEVVQGNLSITVTATGTLQPTNRVDVGSDGRVAEGARLESVYTGNRIVGSNPTPSASS